MKALKWGFIILAGLYALACLALLSVDAEIFKPPRRPFEIDQPGFIFFEDRDGHRISGYYREAKDGKPTLLWSHGNAGDLLGASGLAKDFNSHGYGVLAYDYPGYGHSSGEVGEEASYSSALAAYHYLTETKGLSSEDIVLAGQSLGSGPTCWLATQVEHQSVILISPFLSVYRVVLPVPLFPGDRFPNHKRIPEMTQPLLIIHGTADGIITFAHAEKLHQLSGAKDKTLVPLEGVRHNAIYSKVSRKGYEAVIEFLER